MRYQAERSTSELSVVMCDFITATLPAGPTDSALNEIAAKHGRKWLPVRNDYVTRQLSEDERYYFPTSGICDCNTILGAGCEAGAAKPDLQPLIVKHRRQGWSETKIDRWVRDKMAAHARSLEKHPDIGNDAGVWPDLIGEILETTKAKYVGLLLHQYRYGPSDENVSISRFESVRFTNLSDVSLRESDADVLYRYSL